MDFGSHMPRDRKGFFSGLHAFSIYKGDEFNMGQGLSVDAVWFASPKADTAAALYGMSRTAQGLDYELNI